MTHQCLPLYSYLKSLRKKYWASCWFDTSAGIREHTGIELSEVYKGTNPEYFE